MLYVRRQQGFLMVEVIIAMIIISVALISIVSMFAQSIRTTNNAADNTIAVNLAQKRLEILKTENATFWLKNCPNKNINFDKEKLGDNDPPEGYTVITEAVDFPVTGKYDTVKLAQVTVIVEWDRQTASGKIERNKVQLISLLNKNP